MEEECFGQGRNQQSSGGQKAKSNGVKLLQGEKEKFLWRQQEAPNLKMGQRGRRRINSKTAQRKRKRSQSPFY